MKIVLNKCYGGFGISDFARECLGLEDRFINPDEIRTNESLIQMVECNSKLVSAPLARLRVIEIPEEATDWYVDDYDGMEELIYVMNGKLVFA